MEQNKMSDDNNKPEIKDDKIEEPKKQYCDLCEIYFYRTSAWTHRKSKNHIAKENDRKCQELKDENEKLRRRIVFLEESHPMQNKKCQELEEENEKLKRRIIFFEEFKLEKQ